MLKYYQGNLKILFFHKLIHSAVTMADRPNIKADADAQSSGYTSNAEVNSTSTTNSGSESHLSAQGACALPTENSPGINDTLPKSVCPRLDHGNISQGGKTFIIEIIGMLMNNHTIM